MKLIPKLIILVPLLHGCIGTDFERPQEEVLRISQNTDILRVTESFSFDYQFINSLAQEVDTLVTWNSSNESVLLINDNGLATGVEVGESVVSVHLGELTDEITVQVVASQESITISDFVSTISVGSSFEFSAVYTDVSGSAIVPQDKVWTSSNTSILSVTPGTDGKATVNALSAGTAEITVQAGNVKNTVTVQSTSTAIMVDEEVRITNFTNSLDVNDDFSFEARFFDTSGLPDDSATILWESSDPSVISIDDNGLATAIGSGQATITASVGSVQSSVSVNVINPVASTERTVTMEGSTYQVSGTAIIKEVDGDIVLELNDVQMGRSAPGPYYFLSNASGNVNSGLNLGKFVAGTRTINVSDIDNSVTLDSFDYLLIWCDPFNITLGFGEFSE